jgi:hypothetical protein
MAAADEDGVAVGTVLLDKYRVEGTLGRGGMGVVVRAYHDHAVDNPTPGQPIAVKLVIDGGVGGIDIYRI